MAQVIADRRDVDFVLFEQMEAEALSRHDKFAEFNRKTMELVVSEARNLAVKEILPTQQEGDRTGCRFDSGVVTVPECYKRPWQQFCEGEWLALTEDPEYGGQGMPRLLAMAANDYLVGANFALMMYAGLTHGAALLVEAFGSQKIRDLFLKQMFTGRWTGTMLLTEPEAGSDVGRLTTSAVKNADGTYSISGSKIFISSGEHDLAENIIHPVLARIEGAPAGTKGISLFLVPKIWVNDDGSLGEFNDVVCTGIEEKMGIHGNATCSLTLGGKGRCRGYLLGEEHKGMRAMFLMMNEARLLVGLQAMTCASNSYLNALNYARQRVQGRHLLQMLNPEAPAVPIIQHPDVRRMLMTMKVYVEGMRSLLYYICNLTDKINTAGSDSEKARLQGMIDLLIPIAKGYVSDRSQEVCNLGLQIYGGYGYIREYPQEQLVRDCRITQIYEGTNGIQAMDLLGRKLGLNQGKPMMDLMGEIQKTVARAKEMADLQPLVESFEKALQRLGQVAMHLGVNAMSPQALTAFAFANGLLEAAGDVVMGWLMLWRSTVAAAQLGNGAKKKDESFYQGQVKSAQFFIQTLLPVTMGKMDAIMDNCAAAVEIDEKSFGS
jgi:alkylation response protein AidB-like acyl-CoA dehydrogenase